MGLLDVLYLFFLLRFSLAEAPFFNAFNLLFCFTLMSCNQQRTKAAFSESDTTQILQVILTDSQLESSLNGFKKQQLKIVQNQTISKQYNVYKNGKLVLLSDIDSTSETLLNPYKPAFYLEVTKLEMVAPNEAKVFFRFKGTGLTFSANLKKQTNGSWEIVNSVIGYI